MGNRNNRRKAVGTQLAASADKGFSLISNQKLIDLYAGLLRCRIARENGASAGARAADRRYAGLKGMEAGLIGTTIDLGAEDRISFYGTGFENGGASHESNPMHRMGLLLGTPAFSNGNALKSSVSSRVSAADRTHPDMHAILGAALAHRTSNSGRVSVVIAQDAQPLWDDAVHIAAVHILPIIFVHQPLRKTAVNETGRRKNKRSNGKLPDAPYLPSITVDKNDVVAIYRVTSEAVARARKGRGPTVIECQPFQLDPHAASVAGNNGGSGSRSGRDPILCMESYLRGKGLFSPEIKASLLAQSLQDLKRAHSPAPRSSL